VELFFRWFKCILGCRHLLSTSPNGITIQLYLGIIASLLIILYAASSETSSNTWKLSVIREASLSLCLVDNLLRVSSTAA
jgi:hypothetical protein